MADKSQKTQKKSRFKELSNEFKKIVWPDKMTLAKQTAAVVAVSVILGGLIAIIDFVLKYGVDLLVNLKLG
ncbi:preprotein translocase subunit SecE [Ohessyouella blattaphilus]|uniref:Preprotein translocase subunit SecE n=1 Tax=Ohessyouella blattaphilus TaxID=2949333 RepID=A0ABT1ENW3_9FIRM|nr:preprotein translocase subunit SecE [Ohessyouella blattaphilus]MCP1110972.1 preprotein translocase subunit SecE [Ohessyouella blattaphilus]MCR8564366.1 preprotein translocase subunit SecE [Ohessyouella blattaphilus]